MIAPDIAKVLDDATPHIAPDRRMFKSHMSEPTPIEETVRALKECNLQKRSPDLACVLADPTYSPKLRQISVILLRAMTKEENLTDEEKRVRTAVKEAKLRPRDAGVIL